MDIIIHRSNSRGFVDHGWLKSYHSFSFGNYYDPERINFGALRVLNDDSVAPGKGFGRHPHDNMEIISIPLAGDLEHEDSMGNREVIKEGELQVMSAGKGVYHSEYNKNADKECKFLQIWIFPDKKNVEPRYDKISIPDYRKKDCFYLLVSPSYEKHGVWIHQKAWLSMAELSEGKELGYDTHSNGNGIYIFVLEGSIDVSGVQLSERDGAGIRETGSIRIQSLSTSSLLVIEVPMDY